MASPCLLLKTVDCFLTCFLMASVAHCTCESLSNIDEEHGSKRNCFCCKRKATSPSTLSAITKEATNSFPSTLSVITREATNKTSEMHEDSSFRSFSGLDREVQKQNSAGKESEEHK